MVEILCLLAAAVAAVLVFSHLRLGSVLGYLAAGAIIGPHGLAFVTDAENLRHIGEFGVVFLLFIIGLEMKPQRLLIMRRLVFGLGGTQVFLTGIAISVVAFFAFGHSIETSLVIGFGLALSSTAFGVQLLSERNEIPTQHGRNSFAILLFQDLAVVPLMVLIPLLAATQITLTASVGIAALQAAAILIAVLVLGRYAIGPVLHAIARIGNSDTFVALALFLVLGFAWIMEHIGLSLAMGAFVAGVLMAESEYRHQVEADILPFRGLLLGLFFMSVGMSLHPGTVYDNLSIVLLGTVGLLMLKAALVIVSALIWRVPFATAVQSGFLLSQAGEFGFVLFSLAAEINILPPELLDIMIAVIVLSMVATPLMVWAGSRLSSRLEPDVGDDVAGAVSEEVRPVLIAGFGRVGETVANMLSAVDVPYVAIDASADCVAQGRKRGYNVYFGSAARPELLHSVGAANAKLLVVTLDDPKSAEHLIQTTRQHFPHLPIHVRARDWNGVDAFKAMGVTHAMPETVEASLRLGAKALEAAGVDPDTRRQLFEDLTAEDFEKLRNMSGSPAS